MFVTTVVQKTQVMRKAEQKPEFLDAEVGSGKRVPPASAVGRLDQPLQNVQSRSLDPVAEQKLLTAWESLHRRSTRGENESEIPAPGRLCASGRRGRALVASIHLSRIIAGFKH